MWELAGAIDFWISHEQAVTIDRLKERAEGAKVCDHWLGTKGSVCCGDNKKKIYSATNQTTSLFSLVVFDKRYNEMKVDWM